MSPVDDVRRDICHSHVLDFRTGTAMSEQTKDLLTGILFIIGAAVSLFAFGWCAVRQIELHDLEDVKKQRLEQIEVVLKEHREARQQNEDH